MKKQATKIKICGLTKEKEADYLNQIHADFAGMVVFFPKSKRNISLEQAKKKFDAAKPGSGKTFDWTLLKDIPRSKKLFMLAGGLAPENVSNAIFFLHPDGVDVSSGVEFLEKDRPGKDPYRIQVFAEAVQFADKLTSKTLIDLK